MRTREGMPNIASAHLLDLFDAAVAARPDHPAVLLDGAALTYAEADRWSHGVASALHERGVARGDLVALRMPAGPQAVVAILGILRCGAAYVPLDLRNPPDRNRFVLADCRAGVLVGVPQDGLDAPRLLPLGLLDDLRDGDAAPIPGPTAADVAYVIYTSGTTGRPKGVPVKHANAVALLRAAREVFDFSEEDRWLQFHSLAFDFSVWEIWGALSTGGAVVLMPPGTARSPRECLRIVADEGVTVLNQTPTAFASFAETALTADRALPRLRYVIFGGEKVDASSVRAWADRFGLDRPKIVNGYGITETTVFTTFHPMTRADLDRDASVIGRALPGFGVRIVDGAGGEAPEGTVGELWLAGPQVADGYLGRPALTERRFRYAPDPDGGAILRYYATGDLVRRLPDGDLAFEGRADLQVKLRGHRVELTEIEAAVRKCPEVLDAVVLVRAYASGDRRLCCAFVPRAGGEVTGADLRRHVAGLLPDYMRPAHYLRLDVLPRTVNGKADRDMIARLYEKGEDPR
ncbi:amino acid adenylation domain-containing protein [Actinocorallia sp. A-T 12471]|uniref:amino acid adenylation domain-containing protein n=1 Tax=Actinocorallia sp. A-T 12471 TaxID=3089813 RepID=UPI0029D3907E|nr:amino acid adenylation domain-containing protein [Actinocorallia sp. A-T 12471]MDX6741525.1 amino acid adenylation domain-containing protein [Actinocorallia sp. A-T 12471]